MVYGGENMGFLKEIKSKKWLVVCFALTLCLGLAACSNSKKGSGADNTKSGTSVDEPVPEFTYVAKFLDAPDSMMMSGNMAFGKDAAYSIKYDYSSNYSVDENGDYVFQGSDDAEEADYGTSYSIVKYPLTSEGLGEEQTIAKLPKGYEANGLCVDEAGNVYYVATIRPKQPGEGATDDEWNAYYEKMYSMSDYHMIKLDPNGNQLYDMDFTEIAREQESFYGQEMAADSKGRVCVYSYNAGLMLFDENGKYIGKIEDNPNSWIAGLGTGKDGNIYAAFNDYSSVTNECVLSLIDFKGKKFGKKYSKFPASNGNACILPGLEKDVLCCDSNSVQEYSLEKEESTKLLNWMDCDVDGSMVTDIYVYDGKIFALIYDWNNGSSQLAELTKMRTEDVVRRETIMIGTLYQDQSLNKKALEFNKTNEKYRVTIKTYMDENNWSETSYTDAITTMTNDLIAGKGPDIIDLSYFDGETYAEKGVLEDLAPYLEKSTVLHKEDFLDRILEAGTINGKLVSLASTFTLETLAGKKSVVGDKMGWTVSDMIKLKKAYPNSNLIEYETKEQILSVVVLMLNLDHFMDVAKGTCDFDNDEFKEILQFANMFPADVDYEAPRPLTPYQLADNSLLLNMTWIYGFRDMQSEVAYFGDEPVTFIGFPNYDGGNGCMLRLEDQYAINAASTKKEAAWSFLESVITAEQDESMMFAGFPTLKALYEKQKAKSLEVHYVLDENGEKLLDINGNPIIEDYYGGGYTMIGDNGEEWSYNYKPITKEEVDMVDTLLAGSKLPSSGYDEEMLKIITEEADGYFNGAKSVDEAAKVIQSRLNLYLKENK